MNLSVFERIHPPKFLSTESYKTNISTLNAAKDFKRNASIALKLYLDALSTFPEELSDLATSNIIYSCGVFSSPDFDEWSELEHFNLSLKLYQILESKVSEKQLQRSFRIILEDFKEVFRGYSKKVVTEDGRVPHQYGQNSRLNQEYKENLWITNSPEATAIFTFTISKINFTSSNIKIFWPLIVPPLLTIMEYFQIRFVQRGQMCLRGLLENSAFIDMLRSTGLDGVFCETTSKGLLLSRDDGFPALLDITIDTLLRIQNMPSQRNKLEDIFNDAILRTFVYSGDKIPVAVILLKWIPAFLDRLGILSVKYLKDIIPLLCGKISYPPIHPGVEMQIRYSALSLSAIIKTCWIRINRYGPMILTGLATAWTNFHDNDMTDCELTLNVIQETTKLLILACGEDLDEDRRELQKLDEKLFSSLIDVKT